MEHPILSNSESVAGRKSYRGFEVFGCLVGTWVRKPMTKRNRRKRKRPVYEGTSLSARDQMMRPIGGRCCGLVLPSEGYHLGEAEFRKFSQSFHQGEVEVQAV